MTTYSQIEPLSNHVIYLPYWKEGSEVKIGDLKFTIDKSYAPGEHQPIHGKILAVPPFLDYDFTNQSLDWDTNMELCVGDEVVCNFYDVFQAIEGTTRKQIKFGDEEALLIRYDRIYAAKRDNEIVPINGYVFVEPIAPVDLDKFENVNWRKHKHDTRFGIVRHVGSRLKKYKYDPYAVDDFDPEIGQIYAFDNACDLVVEHDEHRKFFDKKMFRMQRKNIIGKVSG